MSTYGRCPVCQRVVRILVSGRTAEHRRKPDDWRLVVWPICTGSGHRAEDG